MIVTHDPAEVAAIAAGRRPWVAIGNFDGLHRGHAGVIRGLKESGADAPAVVLSFDPHPAEVLGGRSPPLRLLSDAQRDEILAAWGVDALLLLRFDRRVADMSPEDFVEDVLLATLRVQGVRVGAEFRFGHDRAGDVVTLGRLLAAAGAEAVGVEPLRHEGAPISSTRIRGLIAAGDMGGAAELLGRPYVLEGLVVEGDRRGRSLGFPTANLHAPGRALPGSGVYAALAAWGERTWPAAVNVGLRPTFGGDPAPRAEVHVLGEPGDLYGRTMRVAFVERVREERRFAGPADLAEQIGRDVLEARALVAGLDPGALRVPGF